jgi:hypothetical protein
MTAGGDKLLMKITVAADETPELFRTLRSVKDPRRRTRRLKDLATKGLLFELTCSSRLEASARTSDQKAWSGREMPERETVGSMLDWMGEPR